MFLSPIILRHSISGCFSRILEELPLIIYCGFYDAAGPKVEFASFHILFPVCSSILLSAKSIQMPMIMKTTANTSAPYSWSFEALPDL